MIGYDGWLYIVLNILGVYILYKFMRIFYFKNEVRHRRLEAASYLFYYLSITLLCIIGAPGFLLLMMNVLLMSIITFNYKSSMRKRILVVFLIYIILLIIEIITVLIFICIPFFSHRPHIQVLVMHVGNKIIALMTVLILSNIKNLRHDIKSDNLQWIAVFIFPVGSLVIFFTLLTPLTIEDAIFCFFILLLFNIFMFYLQDTLNNEYLRNIENELIKQQNKYYLKQIEIMEEGKNTIKMLQHDYKNHNIALRSYLQQGNVQMALSYTDQLMGSIQEIENYCSSGEISIDSIVNYKVYIAKQKDINIKVNLHIPSQLHILALDLTIIIGNLLDNAIEAAERCEKERIILLDITYEKQVLFISIENTFDGKVCIKGGRVHTRKKDSINHGLGLINVQKVVDKYQGELEIDYTNNRFYIDLMLYDVEY